ncbi:MAG TPA: ATP-binding protein [Halanaerobiaceae bacterium]|jgi:hypothetical protein|nr:ATP-binding protein [Bacillota bacterium]HHU92194.1 ATP-binding protein [Halanaerobiaceae bacterium]HPZ63573.1 ATP-binding protein [Halanaerobiales bacterium]HQD04901.1 ATP-binding protein [Halanaerobiales bacterium]
MRELSLHILDIVQNSISATASLINIYINENLEGDLLTIKIRDNGRGIPEEQLLHITDPFYTTRTTREVGLGLSLFRQTARRSGGGLEIKSQIGAGTEVTAFFAHSHIDRPPMGDIKGTLLTLIALNPDLDFTYQHLYRDREFFLDTRVIKEELEGIEINQQAVLDWLGEFIKKGLEDLYGGEG